MEAVNVFTKYLDMIKLSYSRYITAIFFNVFDDRSINYLMDKIIKHRLEENILGDKDLRQVILYAINRRKLEYQVNGEENYLPGMVCIKSFIKSIFNKF